MNYVLVAIATMSRRAKSIGVHKCSGASAINIFSMFLFETGIVVLMSVIVALFIIFNTKDLIEDLLSVQLSSLFTLENSMGSDAHCFCTVHGSRSVTGKIVFTHSCHSSFSSLHRWEKKGGSVLFICTIYGSIFCNGDFVSIFDAVSSFD